MSEQDNAPPPADAPPPGSAPPQRPVPEVSEEEYAQYWRKLDKLRMHKNFAESYIKTLAKFKPNPPNPEQQKVVDNVRNYLKMFLILCEESRESFKPRAHPLKTLQGCEKTLTAVLKRAASSSSRRSAEQQQRAQAAGGVVRGSEHLMASDSDSPGLPTTHMLKWGFLQKKDRWLRFDGQFVQVFTAKPEPEPPAKDRAAPAVKAEDTKADASSAPLAAAAAAAVEVTFDMSKAKLQQDKSGPLKFSIHYGDCIAQFVADDEQAYVRWCRKLFLATTNR
eukprot:SAG22_NODE_2168_length_2899_cov_1.834286_1_plen_278_part_10